MAESATYAEPSIDERAERTKQTSPTEQHEWQSKLATALVNLASQDEPRAR